MTIWALGDLHLARGVPGKEMDIFGPAWEGYGEKIEKNWCSLVSSDDLVLLPGDISWGMRKEEVAPDLAWIDSLPGTKVMIRGNHDYWWGSFAQVQHMLPPSIHAIQHTSFVWKDVAITGTRLWDTDEYNFPSFIDFKPNPKARPAEKPDPSIFPRELGRLELGLKSLPPATQRIVMTHYPPIGADLAPSKVSALLEKYHVDCCVFGHLHNVREGALPFGEARGVRYHLASADYLHFLPLKICG